MYPLSDASDAFLADYRRFDKPTLLLIRHTSHFLGTQHCCQLPTRLRGYHDVRFFACPFAPTLLLLAGALGASVRFPRCASRGRTVSALAHRQLRSVG